MKETTSISSLLSFMLLICLIGCSKQYRTTTPLLVEEVPTPQLEETEDMEVAQSPTLTDSPSTLTAVASICSSTSDTPLMNSGEKLLFVDSSDSGTRIIAIDDTLGKTEEIYNTKEEVFRLVASSDGTQLAYLEEKTIVFFNLRNGTESRYPLSIDESLLYINRWTEDGKVIIKKDWEENDNGQIEYQNLIVDAETGKVEVKKGQYYLPGYIHVPDGNLFAILAIDPTEERALYQRWIGEGSVTSKATLIDLNSQKILWENPKTYSGAPGWANDGSRVVFGSIFGKDPFPKILSLSREGEVSVLAHHLPDPYRFNEIRYFKVSPDNRYVHYALQKMIELGPGFVLDERNEKTWEICGYSGDFIYSWWLNKPGYLVYETKDSNTKQFWIFDVQTGKSRKLINGKNISYIGYYAIQSVK